MMITVYGIPNCDTIKKTLDWLKKNKIEYQFYNYKTDGINIDILNDWCSQKNWEILLNKKSTTWRELSSDEQQKISNTKNAVKLMQQKTSIIKRPVITKDKMIVAIGFDEKLFAAIFKK